MVMGVRKRCLCTFVSASSGISSFCQWTYRVGVAGVGNWTAGEIETGAGTVTKVLLVDPFLFGAVLVAVMVDMTDSALRTAKPAGITKNLSATAWGRVKERSLRRCVSRP